MEENPNGQVVEGSLLNENVSKGVREVFDWGVSFIFAIVICSFVTMFIMFFTVSGDSMLPTLNNGDRLFVSKFMYTPKKGDIVTINTMDSLDKNIIKRIIATSGDSFEINYDTHEIYVNGKLLYEPYIYEPTALRGDWKIPVIIPNGYVVVMGDNRNHSFDSRFKDVGLIKISQLYGKAFMVFWPFDRIRTLG